MYLPSVGPNAPSPVAARALSTVAVRAVGILGEAKSREQSENDGGVLHCEDGVLGVEVER